MVDIGEEFSQAEIADSISFILLVCRGKYAPSPSHPRDHYSALHLIWPTCQYGKSNMVVSPNIEEVAGMEISLAFDIPIRIWGSIWALLCCLVVSINPQTVFSSIR